MTETVIIYCPTVNRARNSGAVDGFLGAVVKGKPEVSYNTSRTDKSGRKLPDGIELRFGDARPTEQVRVKLKEHGFQFSEKQVIWYSKDTPKARELVESLEVEEWEIDTTVYEKHSFWAMVRSMKEYHDLRGWVEFMVVGGGSNSFYNNKKQLEAKESPNSLVGSKRLKFKKFWSKPVGEDGEGEDGGNGDGESPEGDEGYGDGHQEDETRGDDDLDTDDEDLEDLHEEEGNGSDDHKDIAEKLARAAAAMQPQIDHKMNPPIASQGYTARRQRIIDGLRAEGRQMQRTQSVLAALSIVWGNRKIERFPLLGKIRLRSQIELLMRYSMYADVDTKPATIQASLDHNKAKLNHLQVFTRHHWFDAYRQINELLKDEAPAPDPKRQHEQELAEMIAEARRWKIPGFFPTPEKEVDRMIDLAEIKPSDRVLDPSAGIGSILDRVAELRDGETKGLEAIEIAESLRSILEKKGYLLIGRNFMEQNHETSTAFKPDKILMNPPFENGQDMEHVTHALKFLKQGGRLVAIMGAGAFYRDFKRDKAFRELLAERNAWVSGPIHDAFKTAFNPTGVTVRMVIFNEDGTRPLLGGREIRNLYDGRYWTSSTTTPPDEKPGLPVETDDDLELLELEAEAELELLKMRVEQERRAKGILNGLGATNQNKLESLRRKAWAMMDSTDVLEFK